MKEKMKDRKGDLEIVFRLRRVSHILFTYIIYRIWFTRRTERRTRENFNLSEHFESNSFLGERRYIIIKRIWIFTLNVININYLFHKRKEIHLIKCNEMSEKFYNPPRIYRSSNANGANRSGNSISTLGHVCYYMQETKFQCISGHKYYILRNIERAACTWIMLII